MRNIISADNQEITRLGFDCLVQSFKLELNTRAVENKIELTEVLMKDEDAVVIIDYTLFDFTSIGELQILSERCPKSDWILFSEELSDSFLREVQAHSMQFSIILKSSTIEEISSALRAALNRETYWCASVSNHMKTLRKNSEFLHDYNLTTTEKEVLKEIALGKTTKEIAFERNLSFHTVITHRKNIFRKLGVNNLHEATKYAMKAGLVDVSEYYI